jgi:hypothetical protein
MPLAPVPPTLDTPHLAGARSLLDDLVEPAAWRTFQDYKRQGGHLLAADDVALETLITSAGYAGVAEQIRSGSFALYPRRKLVNKHGSGRKRVVYTFDEQATWVLKLLAFLLYRYDSRHQDNCYSFRRQVGAHQALRRLTRTPEIDQMWCLKTDVADYFNAIAPPQMLAALEGVIDDDPRLLAFFDQLLSGDGYWADGELEHGPRGVMAGTPTAPFFANVYLRELDQHFAATGALYARYSDDIIVFAPTEQEINQHRATIHAELAAKSLQINPRKTTLAQPGERWDFLGFGYQGGRVDLAQATKAKLKGRIRRKARALRRWMLRNDAAPERAAKAFIRSINTRLYGRARAHDLTWSRWFFPLLTTDQSLRELDTYLRQYIRYIPSGRFSKRNFAVRYETLKDWGYRPLVNEYHRQRRSHLQLTHKSEAKSNAAT